MATYSNWKPDDGPMLSVSRAQDQDNVSVHSMDSLIDEHKVHGKGVPTELSEASWKDYLAMVCCFGACAVAVAIVYVQSWAGFFGLKAQFAWIGACLTVMAWCTQPFVRRLFLCSAISHKKSSNLQTLDAILRSDPLTEQANIGTRMLLVSMLALSPGLSVVYKLLDGGTSWYAGGQQTVQIGLTGPPGTQYMGYGMSQFVNATIPWFEDPAFQRVYGFNLAVINENTTALLDAPMPDDLSRLQQSLGNGQGHLLHLTGVVSATVCSLNPDLDYDRSRLDADYNSRLNLGNTSYAGKHWVWKTGLQKGMFLPNNHNATNVYIASFNENNTETFGSTARRYNVARQNFSATWLVTDSYVQLDSAVPLPGQFLEDKGVFTNLSIDSALPQLMIDGLVEYDTGFRISYTNYTEQEMKSLYEDYIKTEATLLGAAVWARFTAWIGPENWFHNVPLNDEQKSTLRYTVQMDTEKGAYTVQRGAGILITLLAFPVLMIATFAIRLIVWSQVPIGSGFGLISLLASVDPLGRKRLEGAGLSGKLEHPLSVQFIMRKLQARSDMRGDDANRQSLTTLLGEPFKLPIKRLQKGVLYR